MTKGPIWALAAAASCAREWPEARSAADTPLSLQVSRGGHAAQAAATVRCTGSEEAYHDEGIFGDSHTKSLHAVAYIQKSQADLQTDRRMHAGI